MKNNKVSKCLNSSKISLAVVISVYYQSSYISGSLVGNKTDDYSDVVEATPVGTAPSLFMT